MRRGAQWSIVVACLVLAVWSGQLGIAWAQSSPPELSKTDITKLKTIDAGEWAVLGVRLGDTKENALMTLKALTGVKVQEDAPSSRIFVITPPSGNTVVMSIKVVENQVTTINLVGGFGEWLQGDTKILFRAFEDDSLRYKLLGREDSREVVRGGTKEAPTLDITYAYFKEGIVLHYSARSSSDGKQLETSREFVLINPARVR
jgi:hypothetical protein